MNLRNSFDNSPSKKDLYTDPKELLNPKSRHYDRTQQHMAESCNINNILKKVQPGQEFEPDPNIVFADVSNIPDLMNMQNQVIKAMDGFATLPIQVRKKYNHNPSEFLQALQDPEEKEFLTKYGVFQKPAEEKPDYLKQIAENTAKSDNSVGAQLLS